MRTAWTLVVVIVLLWSRRAGAEGPSAAEKDAAREMARRGAAYFDNGQWEMAREHFRRAYDIVGAPTLALMEARALVQLGSLMEAEDAYSRAVNVSVDSGNAVYRKAREDAGAELAALRPRVPSLRIVAPASGPKPEVKVDGLPRTDFAWISLNPGTHLVSVSQRGLPDTWQSVTLREGDRRTIAIAEREPVSRSPSNVLMWSAFGLGAAGLATGVVTGALALDRKATLDRACNGTTCPVEVQDDLTAYHRLRTVSFVGYVTGFIGTAGGIALLATRRKEPGSAKVQAFVSASPAGVVVSGNF
jgi:hypothetical protein